MDQVTQQLFLAEQKAKAFFKAVEDRGLIIAGKSEKQLADEIVQIAKEDFGAGNHWGKKLYVPVSIPCNLMLRIRRM